MSTNISKKKRDDLLDKIKQIRAFIAAAPQDENTGNLLSYLSDLEKDVNGKKYGLVFEEHREEIDEVLDTHTPVLTEDADLFIDHGGQMNFLIEGDNLASLKLLEKTHKGKIDLIYIDPPYNTGASNWIYDNDYVDGNDLFKHSKWLSMMQSRLTLAKNLLTDKVVINDFDPAIYAFWYCLLNNTEQLCEFISTVPLTVKEWDTQHNVYINQGNHTRLELAQATLFLNRTNVSGVITGGMIGKRDQSGNYKLDARFNRAELVRKVRTIAALSDRIDLYNLDAIDFLQYELRHYYKAFINFDPPYVIKGGKLYKNAFTVEDHRILRDCIARCHRKWIVTYDVCDLVSELYAKFRKSTLDIYYSANNVRTAKEYIFFSDNLVLPDNINLTEH